MKRMGKKKLLKLSPVLVAIYLMAFTLYGQDELSSQRYSDYQLFFEHPREEIYLDLPKNIFYTNEPIQFAGYVFDKLKSLPAVTTTNVYCAIYDKSGELVIQKLFYAQEGKFEGSLNLPPDFSSGKYYIRAFTNWMRNFGTSSMYLRDIYVVDENFEPNSDLESSSSAQIQIHPESYDLVAGIRNSIGFAFTADQTTGGLVNKCVLVDAMDNVLVQETI